MKSIRSLFISLAVSVFLSCTVQTVAQVGIGLVPYTFLNGGTNNVAAATTNTYSLPSFPVIYGKEVSFLVSAQMAANTNTDLVFVFDRSVDAVNWETNTFSLTLTCNTTNQSQLGTNFNAGGYPFYRLDSIQNPNTQSATTNVIVKSVYKRGF